MGRDIVRFIQNDDLCSSRCFDDSFDCISAFGTFESRAFIACARRAFVQPHCGSLVTQESGVLAQRPPSIGITGLNLGLELEIVGKVPPLQMESLF